MEQETLPTFSRLSIVSAQTEAGLWSKPEHTTSARPASDSPATTSRSRARVPRHGSISMPPVSALVSPWQTPPSDTTLGSATSESASKELQGLAWVSTSPISLNPCSRTSPSMASTEVFSETLLAPCTTVSIIAQQLSPAQTATALRLITALTRIRSTAAGLFAVQAVYQK